MLLHEGCRLVVTPCRKDQPTQSMHPGLENGSHGELQRLPGLQHIL